MAGSMRAAFSNHWHQLLVSVSRHLYVNKKGIVVTQEKPMEVNLKNCGSSKKEHLVYYILRDAFSGNFIYQLATSRYLPPLLEFLHWAWRREDSETHFWGLPRRLSVPKTVSSPELLEGLERAGIEAFHPSSGFVSGVRVLRDLEDNLALEGCRFAAVPSLASLERVRGRVYHYLLDRYAHEETKLALWEDSLPDADPVPPPPYREFLDLFDCSRDDEQILPLARPLGAPAPVERDADLMVKPLSGARLIPQKLHEAEELLFEAILNGNRWLIREAAFKALERSLLCVEAYNQLGYLSEHLEEKELLFERAKEAGEEFLGPDFFDEELGNFWVNIDTRPYMNALAGLAGTLYRMGERERPIALAWEMLRLNPDDHQGMRYLLANWLLEDGRLREAGRLFEDNLEDTTFMLYSQALWHYLVLGPGETADAVLRRAMEANPYAPAYLLGEKRLPYPIPHYYAPGEEDEAVCYAERALNSWKQYSGAVEWLATVKDSVGLA